MGKNAKNIVLGNVYRSPSYHPASYLEEITKKLDKLTKHKNKHILISGDTNIDVLNYATYKPAQTLVNHFSENGFAPVISRPTRVTNHTATLIDHIFVNSVHMITKSGVITEHVADHLAPYVTLLIDQNKPNHRNITFNKRVYYVSFKFFLVIQDFMVDIQLSRNSFSIKYILTCATLSFFFFRRLYFIIKF